MTGAPPVSRDLFRVSKDWDNAPDGYQESQAPRALEIKRLMRAETLPPKQPSTDLVELEVENLLEAQ